MSLTPLEIRFEAAVGDYREACPSLTCLRWRRRTDPGEHHVRTNGAEDPAPRDPRPVRDRQSDPECRAKLQRGADRHPACGSARPGGPTLARSAAVGLDPVVGKGRQDRPAL